MGNPTENSDRNSTFRSEFSIVFYRILSEFWAGVFDASKYRNEKKKGVRLVVQFFI